MTAPVPERSLIIRTRLVDGDRLSEIGRKALQDLVAEWLPQTVYSELTNDIACVDVVARKDFTIGKFIFSATFLRTDGLVIKRKEYLEGRPIGKSCDYFDRRQTRSEGGKDGYDHQVVYYPAHAGVTTGRPK